MGMETGHKEGSNYGSFLRALYLGRVCSPNKIIKKNTSFIFNGFSFFPYWNTNFGETFNWYIVNWVFKYLQGKDKGLKCLTEMKLPFL